MASTPPTSPSASQRWLIYFHSSPTAASLWKASNEAVATMYQREFTPAALWSGIIVERRSKSIPVPIGDVLDFRFVLSLLVFDGDEEEEDKEEGAAEEAKRVADVEYDLL